MAKKSALAKAFAGSFGDRQEVPDKPSDVGGSTTETGAESVEPEELVPGPRGEMVPADTVVSMTFTVTAKERYLWNVELSKRGISGVSVLRSVMRQLQEESA